MVPVLPGGDAKGYESLAAEVPAGLTREEQRAEALRRGEEASRSVRLRDPKRRIEVLSPRDHADLTKLA
jgi:hypothetical protein